MFLAMVTAILFAGLAHAANATPERLDISAERPAALIEKKIEGYQTHRYQMALDGNQMLSVDMKSSNSGAYFNILRSGSDDALFRGQIKGAVADIYINAPGEFEIEVYLVRSAARRNEKATYSLAVGLHGPDFADGLAGGPDYWKVAGVGDGHLLNVRRGPSTRYPITGKAVNGDILQNKGCRMTFTERWCQIRAVGIGTLGWVAGEYLREAAPPRIPVMPEGGPKGNGMPFDATGAVACSTGAGELPRRCLFGVIRQSVGNAGVWIALGNGAERYFLFENYILVATDAGESLRVKKGTDTYFIQIGEERFEIPNAVIDGG